MADAFGWRLEAAVAAYLAEIAEPHEYLSLLRWQMADDQRLDDRRTLPGHITTSAFIVSPDRQRILLIDHVVIGRWLQPGGHYEPAATFHDSARREAVEETGIKGIALHSWHGGRDVPFAIGSQDVPGNPKRHEVPHVHHDLQYLFVGDPAAPLAAQLEEVHAAAWKLLEAMADFAPRALRRIRALPA